MSSQWSSMTLGLFVLVGGCVGGDPPTIPVAARWNKAIQQYNLVPIYPMQEDIQIGDVFVYVPPYGDAKGSQPSTWLNRVGSSDFVNTLNVLTADYCQRFRMEQEPIAATAPTTTSDPSKPTTPATPAPTPVTLSSSTTLPNVATTSLTITVPPAAKPAAGGTATQTPAATKVPPLLYAQRCDPAAQAAWAAAQKAAANNAAAAQAAAAAAAAAAKAAGKPPPAAPAPAPAAAPATNATAAAAAAYPPDIQKAGAASDLRLRSIALPEIAVASVTDAELTAAAPISGFLAKIGLIASSNVGLDISLSGIEEVHLPFKEEMALYVAERIKFATDVFPPVFFLEYINQKRPDLLPSACYVDLTALNNSNMQIMIANEVVYAHSIDYSYRSGSTVVGQLGASLIASSAASAAKASTASTASTGTSGNTTTVTTNVTTDAPGSAAAAAKPSTPTTPAPSVVDATQSALAAATTSLSGAVNGMSGAGGTLQAGIGRTGNLTLSEKFAQPMAFGIGDLLEFSPSDLLKFYRRIEQGQEGTISPDGKSVTRVTDDDIDVHFYLLKFYWDLICRDVPGDVTKLTLPDYIFKKAVDSSTGKPTTEAETSTEHPMTEAQISAMARTPPPNPNSRFRPFEGLPTR